MPSLRDRVKKGQANAAATPNKNQADAFIGNVSKVEMAIFTLAVQRHIDSQTTRSQCRASASISKSRSSDAPGV